MRLEDWYFGKGIVPCEPDISMNGRLHGEVYGSSLRPDGTPIHTSKIVAIKDGKCLTYSGNSYELGAPSSAYEKMYPNCRERLLGISCHE